MSPYDSPGAETAIMTAMLIPMLIGLAVFIFGIIMWWNIFAKAGYSGARSLLLLIPFVNLIILIMFAFSKWPVLQELEQRRMQGGLPPNGPMPPYPPQYQ